MERTAEQLDNDVAARVYRQRRLASTEDPLELVTVIDESVLHRPVGAHAGLASSFSILSFGELGELDIAHVEHTVGALILDKDSDVARASLAFECVRSDALDPAESLALVKRLAGL